MCMYRCCKVWVCVSMGVLMCGCVYEWVFIICGCVYVWVCKVCVCVCGYVWVL